LINCLHPQFVITLPEHNDNCLIINRMFFQTLLAILY